MNFRVTSVKNIIEGIKTVITRFPMVVLSSFVGTIIGILLVNAKEPGFYSAILMTLSLGFFLFMAVVLLGERRGWTTGVKLMANSLVIFFLILHYTWLGDNILEAQRSIIIRYIMWLAGSALLISFVSFLTEGKEKTTDSFWHFNKILFFSLALTAIWAGAIQIGISVALASIDFLFDINLESVLYEDLLIIVIGLFSTTFFLIRIPENISRQEEAEGTYDYPKEIKLFSQGILLPLVTLYFVILYAYAIKILITWQWPKGTLAYMILGFSLVGVLTYVSLYPLRAKTSWIRKAGNIFFVVLIPQIGMLFWALWFRISEYSFTENRYFVFVFGCWLLIISLYFLIGKKRDIRIIPITIFIIAILSSFGPWGAFSVSQKSQINRLRNVLSKNGLLVNGIIRKSTKEISFEQEKEISAIIRYLDEMHGLESIQSWSSIDFSTLESKKSDNGRYAYYPPLPERVVEEVIGIDYVREWETLEIEDDEKQFSFSSNFEYIGKPLNISGYNYMIEFNEISEEVIEIDDKHYRFKLDKNTGNFTILKNENMIAQTNIYSFIDQLYQRKARTYQSYFDHEEMKMEFNNKAISLAIYFKNITGEKGDQYTIYSADANLFFSFHNQ